MNTTQDGAVSAEAVPPSQAVVERVAASEGVDPTDLVPLYKTIDPEAIDKLVEASQRAMSALQLTFTYHGYEVTVTGDGVVHLASDHAIKE